MEDNTITVTNNDEKSLRKPHQWLFIIQRQLRAENVCEDTHTLATQWDSACTGGVSPGGERRNYIASSLINDADGTRAPDRQPTGPGMRHGEHLVSKFVQLFK